MKMKLALLHVKRSMIQIAVVAIAAIVVLGPASPFTAQAISAPILVSPANGITTTVGNYPPAAMPYFTWQPVTGATNYRIQVSSDIAFTILELDVITPNTQYIPTSISAFPDNTWYWRVRVEAPLPVSSWSEIRQFTKQWADPSNAPTLLAPSNNATIEFFEDPIFSWTPVMGAADYVLKFDNDFGCPSPLYTYTTLATRYNPPTRFTNGTYYWCVTPRDAGNHDGYPSESRPVNVAYARVPTLLEPANGSQPVYTPRFRWTAVKGAYAYYLYYTTDSTFQTGVIKVNTSQTSYTPESSLPNDVNCYWRVSAVYGPGVEGPFSDVWQFQKKWYQKPINLTPRDNELMNPSLFSWTPVREARYYEIEASLDPGFSSIRWSGTTPNTFFWRNQWDSGDWGKTEYWRVTPYDNSNNHGQASIITSIRPTFTIAFPEAISPRYYYPPPSVTTGNYTIPYNIPVSYDYTLDAPTFYWSRTFVPGAAPRVEADHYKLQVDDDPNFGSPNWTYETQNLSATPTDGVPFMPSPTTTYYWRVTPYAQSGSVLTSSATNQAWAVHIDTSRLVTPTATTSPTLQRPANGEKVMDTLPSFEWLPQQGAVRYEFSLSSDPAFGSSVYVTRTIYTHHTPNIRLPKGTYFWRVRGLDGSNQTVGSWSPGRRLIVAYETRWDPARGYPGTLLPSSDGTLLASDGIDGGSGDLTTLYSAQDKDNWYIGFNVSALLSGQVWYGLYLDGDQQELSGAPSAPSGRPAVGTSTYYRPEHAIYVVYSNTQFITDTVYLHRWDSILSGWDPQIKNLVDPLQVGGSFYYSSTLHYVELKIPKTAIGDQGSSPFVLSVALFSAGSSSATSTLDTVPNNGNATSTLSEFKSIADRVTLSVPVDTPPGGQPEVSSTPHLYAETPNADWLRGFKLEVARDPLFTSVIETQFLDCTGCESFVDIFQYVYSTLRIYEDNTLYWRYLIKHREPISGIESFSPPSEPHSFIKVGPVPTNLKTERNYSTPTFEWDAVEGAANYELQIATNPDFSPFASYTTNHENITPQTVFAPGKYYWRVRTGNGQGANYQSGWSLSSTLNITLPMVSLSSPFSGAVVRGIPTYKWSAVLTPTISPSWGAANYHLQVANSPVGFGSPVEDRILDTLTWTPDATSYADGTYYWHVAVRDAASQDGPFSQVFTFTKQYSVTTLISPVSGSQGGSFPTFIWTPVQGAASYKIEISKDPNFLPLYDSATTHNTRFIPTQQYDMAQYYWRVAIIDKYGRYGPFVGSIFLINPYPYHVSLPVVLRNR